MSPEGARQILAWHLRGSSGHFRGTSGETGPLNAVSTQTVITQMQSGLDRSANCVSRNDFAIRCYGLGGLEKSLVFHAAGGSHGGLDGNNCQGY
jgi:hypothetical protein